MKTLGSYFSETVGKRKSVFGLRRRGRIAYEPTPWSALGDPKIEEKKGHISEPLVLGKICKTNKNIIPKGLQKGEGISGVAPLGAVLGHVWCPKPFFDPKNEPIAPPGTENYSKNDPEGGKHTRKVPPKRPAFRLVF